MSIEYGEPSGPPIVHTEDAVRKKAFFDKPEYTVLCGDAKSESETNSNKDVIFTIIVENFCGVKFL